MTDRENVDDSCLTARREFLLASTTAVTTVVLSSVPGLGWAKGLSAVVARYPRRKLARIGDLEEGVSVGFRYPTDDPLLSASFLVKLGRPAGGGVGPEKDIVAFNAICPHMGGPLMGAYKHEHRAIGPCPFHLTSFDLTKHGMVIAGHATESLPQVVLEVEGEDIYATGVLGLIYGTFDSLQSQG